MDDEAPLWGPFCEVALVPQPGEEVEVGGVVAPVVGVVPEPQRLGRKGRPAHQLAPYPRSDRETGPVDHVHVHAQHRALDLSSMDRAGRLATHQAAAQVGPAGDGGQVDVGLPVGVHVGESLVAERAASGADCADCAQVVGVDGSESGPSHRVDELGRDPEEVDATVVGQVKQPVAVGVEGRSVVEHQGGAGSQAGGQPVPHHPASRREVEDAVSGTDVALQAVLHQVLEQDPTGPVHDALGPTGRARGVQDVEGMVERKVREPDGVRAVGR